MNETSNPTMSRHEIEITRTFEAPVELVWAAFTEPEQFAKWWGPRGFHTALESITLELHVGGKCEFTMVDEAGNEYPNSGTVTAVEPQQLLAFGERDIDHPMMSEADTTLTFKDLGDDRTEVHLHQTMICVPELTEMADQGWNSQFDKLDEIYAAQA